LVYANANDAVAGMIRRAMASTGDSTQPTLFEP
jgi:hypothetical protein